MSRRKSPAATPANKPSGPGRPKDLGKRAAILEAAKRMFTQHGPDRVSMDQIAAEAGVSKLTVYSHFGDKDRLFVEAVRAHCEAGMPAHLFDPSPNTPLRERLTTIANAFFTMVMTPEAIAGHRVLCSPQVANTELSSAFWEAGPKRVNEAFAALLERRIAAGELEIDDPARATCYFFTLVKGELHARALLGNCCGGANGCQESPEQHIAGVVDMFLRAYAKR